MIESKDVKPTSDHPAFAVLGKLKLAKNCVENADGKVEFWICYEEYSERVDSEQVKECKIEARKCILKCIELLGSCLESM